MIRAKRGEGDATVVNVDPLCCYENRTRVMSNNNRIPPSGYPHSSLAEWNVPLSTNRGGPSSQQSRGPHDPPSSGHFGNMPPPFNSAGPRESSLSGALGQRQPPSEFPRLPLGFPQAHAQGYAAPPRTTSTRTERRGTDRMRSFPPEYVPPSIQPSAVQHVDALPPSSVEERKKQAVLLHLGTRETAVGIVANALVNAPFPPIDQADRKAQNPSAWLNYLFKRTQVKPNVILGSLVNFTNVMERCHGANVTSDEPDPNGLSVRDSFTRKVFLVSLMLSQKFTEDDAYGNRAWNTANSEAIQHVTNGGGTAWPTLRNLNGMERQIFNDLLGSNATITPGEITAQVDVVAHMIEARTGRNLVEPDQPAFGHELAMPSGSRASTSFRAPTQDFRRVRFAPDHVVIP
jgi:hypothetical protein